MSTVKVICSHCQKTFEKEKKEYNRKMRTGDPRFFCNLSCTAYHTNMHMSPEQKKNQGKFLRHQYGNSFAKKGSWTKLINKCRNRTTKSKKLFDLSEEYLESLWVSQNKVCAISGIEMAKYNTTRLPNTASLDRIDSSVGYIEGNVQFVCYSINLAKSNFSDEQIKAFLSVLNKS